MTTEAKADPSSSSSVVAASSPSAAATVESKKDEGGVALMTEGRTFTYYYTENDVVNKKELFVYYDASEGKLGSLLWCEAGKREKIAGQAVPLHYISDVYLGKQTPELQSPLAADALSDRCFSIISKEKNVSLHLRCESPSLRNSFLQGIKEIFSRASSAKTPLQTMSKGASFQYFFTGSDSQVAKKEIFLWFDSSEGKLGSLLWNDAGKKEKVNGQVIPLHHISDVFMGKQCPELKSPLASDVPSNQCFSIKSKEIQLNLVASNEKARELWLAGIKEVFTQNANQKKQKQAAAAAAASALANNAPTTANTAPTTSTPAAAPVAASDASGAPKEAETAAVPEAKPDANNATTNTTVEGASPVTTVAAAEKKDESPSEEGVPSTPAAAPVVPVAAAPAAVSTPTPAPASPPAPSADRDALAVLTDGLKLTSYSGSPSASKEIFLFYDNDQPKLGALYWNDETMKREKIAANSILLHKISDVFMGKQSTELKGVSAASTLCFTVAEKNGKSLHLVAQSEKDRKDVLDGIKMIFQKAGKKVDDGKKPVAATTPAVAATHVPAVAATPAPVAASAVVSSRSSDNLLEKGSVFTLYSTKDGKVDAKKVFLFVDFSEEKFGALYYCDEGKREKIKEQTLPLHLISDVFLGKTSHELKSDAAAPVSTSECFSLHTKVRALHLSAPSTESRSSFLDAIRNVFLSKGKRVEDEKPKKALTVNTANASAAAADLASPSSPGAVRISGPIVNEPFVKGVDLTAYFSESGTVVRRRVHVWFVKEDGKYGTLYWNEDGKKEKNSSKSIPFHLITDVYIGKKTPELSATIANAVPSNVCFGIKAKSNAISCETANEAQRNELVNAVKSVFTSVGKQVQEAAKTPAAPKTGKDLLIHGQSFHAYFNVDSQIVRKPVWLFYSADDHKMGSLYWSEKEGDRSKNEANCMALHKISDVFLGKQANELRSAAAVSAPNDHCLSVKTKRVALHLEAKSTPDRNNWLNALRSIFTSGGKSVVEDDSLRIAKKAAAEFAIGDLVSTPYGNGTVIANVRTNDGIISVQSSFGVIHSHFKEVKKAVAQAQPTISTPAAAHVPIAVMNAPAPAAVEATPVSSPAAPAPPVAAPAVAASVDVSAPAVAAPAPASPSSVYDDPSLITDSVRLRAVMEGGHLFTGYSMKGDRVISKRMTLWLSTDSDGDTYLYWTPEGAAKVADIDQGVDVEEIIDVKLGKQSPLFTTVPALAHLDADCCLTIVSEQFTVELVADSPKIAKAWVVAIRRVSPKLKL